MSVAWVRRKVAQVWPERARRPGPAHVALHGALGHADAQLEQLAPDALGAPQPVGGGHLLDQGDRLGGHLGPGCVRRRARVSRQKRRKPWRCQRSSVSRLHDQQGLPPGAHPAGQQHQQRAVARREWARLTLRRSTMSCWRSRAFSAIKARLVLATSASCATDERPRQRPGPLLEVSGYVRQAVRAPPLECVQDVSWSSPALSLWTIARQVEARRRTSL